METIFEHSSFLIKNKEFEKCFSYLQSILSSIPTYENDVYYLKSLYNLSLCLLKLKLFSESKKIIVQNVHNFIKHNEHYYLSKLYFNLGVINFKSEEYKECEDNFTNAINFFDKSYVDDIFYEIKLYYNLGYALYKQEKYSLSINHLNYSISLSISNNCAYKAGEINMLLGILYKRIGELKKSIHFTHKAISYFEFLDDMALLASCQKNVGNFYILVEEYDNALKYLNLALNYFNNQNNLKHCNTIKSDILNALVKKESYKEAITYTEIINPELLNNNDRAIFYNNLGTCFIFENSLELAKKYILLAEETLDPNEHLVFFDIYQNLATLSTLNNNYEEAYNYTKKAQIQLKESLLKSNMDFTPQ